MRGSASLHRGMDLHKSDPSRKNKSKNILQGQRIKVRMIRKNNAGGSDNINKSMKGL